MLSIRNQFQSCFVQIIRNEINAERQKESNWSNRMNGMSGSAFFPLQLSRCCIVFMVFFLSLFLSSDKYEEKIEFKRKIDAVACERSNRKQSKTNIWGFQSLCNCVCVCVTKSSLNLTHFSWASWFGHLRLYDKQNSNS